MAPNWREADISYGLDHAAQTRIAIGLCPAAHARSRISTDSGIAIVALERYRMSLHKGGAKKRPFGFLVSAASFVLGLRFHAVYKRTEADPGHRTGA